MIVKKEILDNLEIELTDALKEKGCDVTWFDDLSPNLWDYNMDTFWEDDLGRMTTPKTSEEIIKEIYGFKGPENAKSFSLMLHTLSEECCHRLTPDDTPIKVLYYNCS